LVGQKESGKGNQKMRVEGRKHMKRIVQGRGVREEIEGGEK